MNRGAELAPALAEAARVVAAVADGSSLDEVLERGPGREAVMNLCFGALRHYGKVQALEQLLSRRGRAAPRIRALLWCALSAAERAQYAPHTLVDQAVRACAILEQPHARGYVNGVLRRYLRERDAVERRVSASEEAHFQHPAWWISRLRSDHPGHWRDILDAGNSHPPLCLRVNRRRIQLDAYQRRLADAGISGRQVGEYAILLDRPIPVARLPGFLEGEVSVQDAGAQRCAAMLGLADAQRVLDACAAPGGKAAHILETANVRLTALDADQQRAARMESGLTRVGLSAEVRVADCTALSSWWDGQAFERVLADVPCTGSGVVRRHPDMKWLRRPDDVRAFAARQQAILEALWRVVAPGGKLLYVTCSVFREENDAVLESFGGRHPDAVREDLPGGAMPQLLPCTEHDGFFFGLLSKTA
jgi:16S rRNA (cytosine967-C5)-methyltransferase